MPAHGERKYNNIYMVWDAGRNAYVPEDQLGPAPQGGAPAGSPQVQDDPPEDQGDGYRPGANGEVRVLMPDKTIKTFNASQKQDLDVAIRGGALPLGSGGQPMNVRLFQGGLLVNGMPLNVLLGGNMTAEQYAALKEAGAFPDSPGGLKDVGTPLNPTNGPATPAPANPTTPANPYPTGPTDPRPTQPLPPGYQGNTGATAPALPQDLQDAIRQMIQESRNQGIQGQQAFTGIQGDYKNFLDYQRGLSEQSNTQRNQFVSQLLGQTNQAKPLQVKLADGTTRTFNTIDPQLEQIFNDGGKVVMPDGSLGTMSKFQGGWLINGNMPLNVAMGQGYTAGQREAMIQAGITPADPLNGQGGIMSGIQSAMATMNDATGLSPQAMAALRQQATEGPERDYQQQVEQLKTTLAGRGAYGGGDTPGSLGDIVRGYAPLQTSRDSTRSNLLAQTILADEQRKFDTLGLNRNTAAQFANIGAGLTTGLANAYNPADFSGAQSSALSGATTAATAATNAGFQGTAASTELLRILQDMEPSSFRNTLYAALLGTATSAIPSGAAQKVGDKLGDYIWDGIKWVYNKVTGGGTPSDTAIPQAPTTAQGFSQQMADPGFKGSLPTGFVPDAPIPVPGYSAMPPLSFPGGSSGMDPLSGGSSLLTNYLNQQTPKPKTTYSPAGSSITY